MVAVISDSDLYSVAASAALVGLCWAPRAACWPSSGVGAFPPQVAMWGGWAAGKTTLCKALAQKLSIRFGHRRAMLTPACSFTG